MFQIVSQRAEYFYKEALALFKTKVLVAAFDWQLRYHIDLMISASLSLCVRLYTIGRAMLKNPNKAKEKMKGKGERWSCKGVKTNLLLSKKLVTILTCNQIGLVLDLCSR